MTYKDLTKGNIEEIKEIYEDYLNEFRRANYSDVESISFEDWIYEGMSRCPSCGEWVASETMEYHRWDKEGSEDKVCGGCKNDE